VKAALGVRVEISSASGSIGAGATSFAGGAPLPPLGRAPGVAALVRVADYSGEVAAADARLGATRVSAEAALGIVEVVERVAAEGADEDLARARHGVLSVNRSRKRRAERSSARALWRCSSMMAPKTLVRVLAVERVAEMPASGQVDAQEGRDQQRGDVASEVGVAQRRHGVGEAVQELDQPRQRAVDGAKCALHGGPGEIQVHPSQRLRAGRPPA